MNKINKTPLKTSKPPFNKTSLSWALSLSLKRSPLLHLNFIQEETKWSNLIRNSQELSLLVRARLLFRARRFFEWYLNGWICLRRGPFIVVLSSLILNCRFVEFQQIWKYFVWIFNSRLRIVLSVLLLTIDRAGTKCHTLSVYSLLDKVRQRLFHGY